MSLTEEEVESKSSIMLYTSQWMVVEQRDMRERTLQVQEGLEITGQVELRVSRSVAGQEDMWIVCGHLVVIVCEVAKFKMWETSCCL